jgi:hypothetical protein
MTENQELITHDKVDEWLLNGLRRRFVKVCEEGLVNINFCDITPGDLIMCFDGDELIEHEKGCKEFEATSYPYTYNGLLLIEVLPKW